MVDSYVRIPMDLILVENSNYGRKELKKRLDELKHTKK